MTPSDVKVCKLHDCFSANEMVTIDGLGLSEPGRAHELVRTGGLISKGRPLGATGLAQCAELCWQLRGSATNRLVPHADVALQHNLGLGGAAVVTVYKRVDGKTNDAAKGAAQSANLGYNPAIEARHVTDADTARVRSRNMSSSWMEVKDHEAQAIL